MKYLTRKANAIKTEINCLFCEHDGLVAVLLLIVAAMMLVAYANTR